MAYRHISNAALRDLAHNVRSDATMSLGKSKRFLDALYDADDALQFRQRVVEQEAARANGGVIDKDQEIGRLRETVKDLRREVDKLRKESKTDGQAVPAIQTTPTRPLDPTRCAQCGQKAGAISHKVDSRNPEIAGAAHPFQAPVAPVVGEYTLEVHRTK